MNDDSSIVEDANLNLNGPEGNNGLYAIKEDLTRHVANAKGELARADEEAKAAAQAKAEAQQIATLVAEVDRLAVTFMPVKERMMAIDIEIQEFTDLMETDPS